MKELVRPKSRNALMIALIPLVMFAAAFPLGHFFGQTHFRLAAPFSMGGALLLAVFEIKAMTAELNSLGGDRALKWWGSIIPLYNCYWAAALVPAAMRRTKESAGKPEPRSTALYLFVLLYAFASDLNEFAEPA
jgi:hypothetical protein